MYFCLSFVDWKTVIHSATSEGRVPDYMLLWGSFPPSNLVYYQQRYVEWKYEYLRDCCVGKLPGRPRISKTPFSHALLLHTFFSSSQSQFASVFVMFSTDFTITLSACSEDNFLIWREKGGHYVRGMSALCSSCWTSDNEVHHSTNAGSFRRGGRICVHFTCWHSSIIS